jgi:hypothetical protein
MIYLRWRTTSIYDKASTATTRRATSNMTTNRDHVRRLLQTKEVISINQNEKRKKEKKEAI